MAVKQTGPKRGSGKHGDNLTPQQGRKLAAEYAKHGNKAMAARAAGISDGAARRWLRRHARPVDKAQLHARACFDGIEGVRQSLEILREKTHALLSETVLDVETAETLAKTLRQLNDGLVNNMKVRSDLKSAGWNRVEIRERVRGMKLANDAAARNGGIVTNDVRLTVPGVLFMRDEPKPITTAAEETDGGDGNRSR